MSADITVTMFRDVHARTLKSMTIPFGTLAAKLSSPKAYPTKEAMPLLSMCRYGDVRANGTACLRHADNVLTVHGVEGDHDAGTVTPEEAILRLERHGIRGLVYTSPSHTADKPRLRILAPFSVPLPATLRERMVARLNGALGGCLTLESFTTSQSFYFGRKAGVEYRCLIAFDDPDEGTCINELDDLDHIAVSPPGRAPAGDAQGERANPTPDADLRELIRSGANYHEALGPLSGRMVGRGMPRDDVIATLQGLMNESTAPRDERWNKRYAEIPRMVDGSIRKFSDPRARSPRRPTEDAHPAAPQVPAPVDLPTALPQLPPVPPFDLGLLPDPLQDWIADGADRAGWPVEFPAVCAMSALGSLLGGRLGIRAKLHDNWTEYPLLWGLMVGPPGAMKSPARSSALRPFYDIQKGLDDAARAAQAEFGEAAAAYRVDRDAWRRNSTNARARDREAEIAPAPTAPEPPPCPTLWTSDATPERLGELLQENPNGLLIERDEINSLLVALEDERNASLRGLLLTGWNATDPYRFDRIIRGLTAIDRVSLTMLGGIQPGPLARIVSDAEMGARADGLLQRFQLAVHPDLPAHELKDRRPNVPAIAEAHEVFTRAHALDPLQWGRVEPGALAPFVRLTDNAYGLFIDWLQAFIAARTEAERTGADSMGLGSHLSKYRGLPARIALVLHVAEGSPGDVSERAMRKALAWIPFLEGHARRIYDAASRTGLHHARMLLARIVASKLPTPGTDTPPFKVSTILRRDWEGFGNKVIVRAALEVLADYGWLIEIPPEHATRGRPPEVGYFVHPLARNMPPESMGDARR